MPDKAYWVIGTEVSQLYNQGEDRMWLSLGRFNVRRAIRGRGNHGDCSLVRIGLCAISGFRQH